MSMRMEIWFRAAAVSAAIAIGASGAAHATLIVTAAPGGGGDNVISASCDSPILGPATTIMGCLNSDHSLDVEFDALENIQFDAGGQATIAPSDGLGYSYLKFSVPGHEIYETILNINAITSGTVTFTDDLNDDSVTLALGGNGSNFFTITGDDFGWLAFNTTGTDVSDVKQVRLVAGVVGPLARVPEPSTLALFGVGLVILAFGARRRAEPVHALS